MKENYSQNYVCDKPLKNCLLAEACKGGDFIIPLFHYSTIPNLLEYGKKLNSLQQKLY